MPAVASTTPSTDAPVTGSGGEADTSAEARPASPDAPARPPLPARIVAQTDVLLPVAILAVVVAWLIGLQRYWWFADDFLYLSQSKDATPDLDFLRVSNYGHFAPITRLAYWIAANPMGLSHGWATTLSVVPLLVSVLVASLIVKELAPSRPALRWLVLLPLLTPFFYRVVPWWGASIHVLTALMWTHLALWCWIKHLRTDRLGWLAGAQLSLVGGLLTQERPMIVVGVFFLLAYLTPPGEGPWHGWPLRWPRELLRWVPLVAIIGAALWNQFTYYPNDLPPPSEREMVKYMVLAFGDYFLPGMFAARGGPVTAPALVLRWVALAVLAAIVVDVIRRRRYWWRAPLFFAATFVVHIGLVGAVKAGVRGAQGVASDGQYYIDASFLAIFAVALALSQPLRDDARPLAPSWRTARSVACGALVLLTFANFPGMVSKYDAEIPGLVSGATYWATASRSLDMEEGSGRQYLPMRLPAQVAPGFVAPFNELADVRRVFLDQDRAVDGDGRRLVAVDRDGVLRDVAPEVIESGNLATEAATGRAVTTGKPLDGPDDQICFDPRGTSGTVEVRTTEPLPAPRWGWDDGPAYEIPVFLAMWFRSTEPAQLKGGSVVRGDQLDITTHQVHVERSGIAVVRLDNDDATDRIFLTGFSGRRVCVGNYAVFRPVALPLVDGGTCDRLGLGGEIEPGVPCPPTRWDPATVVRVVAPSG